MIIDDERTLKFALRSIHMAESQFVNRKGTSNTARPNQIGIADRVLVELEKKGYFKRTNGQHGGQLTKKGTEKLNKLGGPFSFWKERIVASKTIS